MHRDSQCQHQQTIQSYWSTSGLSAGSQKANCLRKPDQHTPVGCSVERPHSPTTSIATVFMMASKSLELGRDEQQTWRSHWLACCGTCTPIDCLSCCTAYFAPCVAYGWTTSRVFRTSFWREMFKYVLVFGLIIFINISFEGARQAACAVPADHQASTGAPPMKPTATCTAMSGALDDVVLWVSVGCAVVWAVYIGGPRRTQLRRLLGIADRGAGGDCCTCCYSSPNQGSGSDCCLHYWCLCCALAQEMRTVMHLKADNKLPRVAPEGYEPLLTKAPVFNGGMTRVEGAPVASMV